MQACPGCFVSLSITTSRHLSLDSQWQLRNLLILLLLVASAEHILTAKTSSDVRDDPPLHSIFVDRS